jgi:hypothetical protein
MFDRYLFPKTDNMVLVFLIWLEILIYFFVLLGLFCSILFILFQFFKYPKQVVAVENMCMLTRVLPWMAFFIIIALSGGYARMRLPIDPFIIILSLFFWTSLFKWKLLKFSTKVD